MAIPVPNLREAKRILAIQPHYDDNDIGAGGALAALAGGGAEVDYLTVTDDLVGVLDATLSDEEATARLRSEQESAGTEIGVKRQFWLGFPDAGDYDHHTLRREIIRHIRMLRPDFLFSVDPWLPYEAHGDHLKTGRAVTEAALLYGFPRLATDPEVDRDYQSHTLLGIALYFTLKPNQIFDISEFRERKHRAIDAYRAQFTSESLEQLHRGLDFVERAWAEGKAFSHGEALKLLSPAQLHCGLLPLDS
jgi:N,N'-diacetylchitobiose non-reducing end deacetylase